MWLFGALAISCLFMAGGWGKAMLRHRTPLSIWNTPLVVTSALFVHAVAMAGFSAVRVHDRMRSYDLDGAHPVLLTVILINLLASKTMLVWAASVREGHRVSVWWPIFLLSIALWTGWIVAR